MDASALPSFDGYLVANWGNRKTDTPRFKGVAVIHVRRIANQKAGGVGGSNAKYDNPLPSCSLRIRRNASMPQCRSGRMGD